MPCRRLTIQEFESLQNPISCDPDTGCNYSCDGNGNCLEDPAGPYTSIAECQENYRNCVVSGPGFCGFRYTRGVGWDLRYSTCAAGFECVDPNLWYGEDPCADCYPPAAACIQQ